MSDLSTRGELRRSVREKMSNTTMDKEAVDGEHLVYLRKSRAGYASNVTRMHDELQRAVSEKCPLASIRSRLDRLCLAFDDFALAHSDYIAALRMCEPDKVGECNEHYADMELMVDDSRVKVSNLEQVRSEYSWQNSELTADDSVSQQGSCRSSVSTASARARAAAKKAALQVKASFLEQERVMERERLETNMNLKQLELEKDIKAAEAEEATLVQFIEQSIGGDDVSKRCVGFNNNTSRETHPLNLNARVFKPMIEKQTHVPRTKSEVGNEENNVQLSNIRDHIEFSDGAPGGVAQGVFSGRESMASSVNVSAVEAQLEIQRQMLDVIGLPKTSLVTFDGNPLEYWSFINAFDCCVGRTRVDDGAKLNRLLEYCKGKAAKVLRPCCLMKPEEGYIKARQLLKERFGNEYKIAESWVKKITEGAPIKPNSSDDLQDLADDVRGCIEALRAMNKIEDIDSRGGMLKVLSRIPLYLQSRWRKNAVDKLDRTGSYPNIEDLAKFLDRVAREMNDPVFGVVQNLEKIRPSTRNKGSIFQVQASSSSDSEGRAGMKSGLSEKQNHGARSRPEVSLRTNAKCYECNGDHSVRDCAKFIAMSAPRRLEAIKAKRLCFNCLETRNHSARWCGKKSNCNRAGCMGKHSKLLHDALQPAAGNQAIASSMACGDLSNGDKVALPILPVWVKGLGQAKYHRVLALLDPGSNRTFCSHALASKLGLEGVETTLSLETLDAGRDAVVSEVSLVVTGTTGKQNTRIAVHMPRVYAVRRFPELKNSMVSPSDVKAYDHIKDIEVPQLEDDVSLLIGQDVPRALVPLEVRYGGENEPYATRTILGWTLNGPLGVTDVNDDKAVCNFVMAGMGQESNLEAQVEQFWKLDGKQAVDGSLPQLSEEDKSVVELWDRSTTKEGCHYVLDIPFKAAFSGLPDNRSLAERRLHGLKRRFINDPQLLPKYQNEIDELVRKGHAERVDEICVPSPSPTWYIPHHNVVNTSKPDKFRVVFDCAAQYANTSLNKEVSQGPDLTNKLLGVLLRFREHRVALIGDIEGMFYQVCVPEYHRDVLRFLWWKNGDPCLETEVYRMKVHLFGGVWSPSCAAYALRRTAEDNKSDFTPDVEKAVLDNFYVDDCLISVADETSAVTLQRQLCEMLSKGGFRLHKWMSNSRAVLDTIPNEDRAKVIKTLDLGASLPVERALGVQWDAERDVLGVQIRELEPVYTRRGVLSTMSSVYDPLGFVGPYVLLAKILFQEECRLEKGWDEGLEEQNKWTWRKWLSDLPKMQELMVERCLIPLEFSSPVKVELHHFCDASQKAYGAVSYLRLVNAEGSVHCSFVLAKTRLAPIKQVTIPRLELLAAVVAVQLEVILRRELTISVQRSIFWSDSMIVLQYIKSRTKRFQTFVANRVSRIHESSDPEQWRYVDTKNNPADYASRGLQAQEMVSCVAWKNGPEFLCNDETSWPNMPNVPDLLSDDKEIKKQAVSHVVEVVDEHSGVELLLKRYSDWFQLKKAVAWLLRFKEWLVNKKPKDLTRKQLDVSELQRAESAIVLYLQRKYFAIELHDLMTGSKMLSRKSELYSLEPFLDCDGILRVGGRLGAACFPENAKHPMILPRDDHVTTLVIRYVHEYNTGHSGREHVLSVVRQKYWIPRARPMVKRVLQQCVVCRRWQGKACSQRMADLPSDRISPEEPAFTHVGIDCFGPFYVKRGRCREKRYGCLFTCLKIRAIHLEKLHSLDADAFINAFVRFMSRRGEPKGVRTDNGTNFVAAEKEIKEAFKNWNNSSEVRNAFLARHIEWQFNPPTASHMGGVWERQIRTVRKVLNVVLKDVVLDDERLDTVLCQVESIVNGRPLTPVSDDARDAEALTPNHLLLLRSGPQALTNQSRKEDVFGRRWRHAQLLADLFWRRWLKEYITSLRLRQKWLHTQRNLKENDVVLVADEQTARGVWPLARVTKVNVSKDDLVRSVEVKTVSSQLVRPVHKLHLLEAAS